MTVVGAGVPLVPATLPVTPEPEFPIRLIALDIDGTIIGDDHEIAERTIEAVRRAMELDVAVSLVTGRMVSSAMRFASELGLTGPLVGYQGGLIRAMPSPDSRRLGKLLMHTPLPAAAARSILEWTRARGLDPHVNHLERFILRADDPKADDYSAFMGARAELVPDLLEAIDHPVTKILAVGEPPIPHGGRAPRQGGVRRPGRCPRSPTRASWSSSRRACPRSSDPLAGPPAPHPTQVDASRRRPVERPRDARRGRARGGDAECPGGSAGRGPVRRRAARGRRGSADDRGPGPCRSERRARQCPSSGRRGPPGPRGPPAREARL